MNLNGRALAKVRLLMGVSQRFGMYRPDLDVDITVQHAADCANVRDARRDCTCDPRVNFDLLLRAPGSQMVN